MVKLGSVVPVLRIFDEMKAREFYIDFLGFKVDFEHRFGDNFPLYLGMSRDGCELHLSEHHGDASPGAYLRIETTGLHTWATELAACKYRYAKPGPPVRQPWGVYELTITDPFHNRLCFTEAAGDVPGS